MLPAAPFDDASAEAESDDAPEMTTTGGASSVNPRMLMVPPVPGPAVWAVSIDPFSRTDCARIARSDGREGSEMKVSVEMTDRATDRSGAVTPTLPPMP